MNNTIELTSTKSRSNLVAVSSEARLFDGRLWALVIQSIDSHMTTYSITSLLNQLGGLVLVIQYHQEKIQKIQRSTLDVRRWMCKMI